MITLTAQKLSGSQTQMKEPLTLSLILHTAVVIFAIVGLPHLKKEIPPIPNSVVVEIFDVQEFTAQTAPNDLHRPSTKPKTETPRKTPPKVTAKTPPKPSAPVPPDFGDASKSTAEVAAPSPLKKPVPKDKVQKAKQKQPLLTQPDAEDHEQEDFQSVLKNLMPDAPEEVQTQTPQPRTENAPAPFTVSEQNALRMQISRCWNLMAGARYAEDLIVDLKLFMNPDGTISEVHILDKARYNSDSFYQAAAESALRALFNPQCTPLDLPEEKYELWKEINVRFDPRNML